MKMTIDIYNKLPVNDLVSHKMPYSCKWNSYWKHTAVHTYTKTHCVYASYRK